ncbi:AvrD family protein [Microbacterium paludicola]|nr:AvrD family protein [Microbacterium paludicola]
MVPNRSDVGFRQLTLEGALGPARGRYFAAGYRGVRHRIREIGLPLAPLQHLSAIGQVVYPKGWSVDGKGTPRQPHLSSVDAIILPLLARQEAVRASQGRAVLRSVRLRAGAEPWTQLEHVPISLEIGPREPTVHALVGNIRASLGLAPGDASLPAADAPISEAADAPISESVYGDLYQSIETESTLVSWDAVGLTLKGEHQAQLSELASSVAAGIEGAFWPSLTAIDYLVTMGQLTQAVIYEAGRRSRASIDNLWMRTMSIDLPARPEPLPSAYRTATTLVRDTVVSRGDRRIHDVRVESVASTGVVAGATLAYTERER